MIKAYIGDLIHGLRPAEVLWPNLNYRPAVARWSDRAFDFLREPAVEIVNDPAQADFFLLPHNYNVVRGEREYLDRFVRSAEKWGKRIIVFAPGDSDGPVDISSSVIFRQSQYRYKMRPNEIIMPGYVEDLGAGRVPAARRKGERPSVGFVGWAKFPSFSAELRFQSKMLAARLREAAGAARFEERQGIWFRRRSMRSLSAHSGVEPRFVLRTSYSGNEKTISLDPERARREYVENIAGTDLTLAVKGDGNFSTRFYEVLSLGRMPLLVDTACPLPLESMIDYDRFVLRVDARDIGKLGEITSNWFSQLTDERFAAMQREAREAFEKYLRMDRFLSIAFEELLPAYK